MQQINKFNRDYISLCDDYGRVSATQVCFYATSGHGKGLCLSDDSLILTRDGEIRLGDIEPNIPFKVISYNVNSHKNEIDTAVRINLDRKEVFEIETFDGRKIRATEDHIFFVKRDELIVETKLSNLREGDFIISIKRNLYPSKLRGRKNPLTLKRNIENNPIKDPLTKKKVADNVRNRVKNPEYRKWLIEMGLQNAQKNKGKTYEEIMGDKKSAMARRQRFFGDKNPAKSLYVRKKISKKLTGRFFSESHRKKISIFFKGKTLEEIHGIEKAKEMKEKLSIRTTLEKNPNWMGGIGNLPYDANFNNRFKKIIINRDSVCLLCGLHNNEYKKINGIKLTIHHIDYDKQNTSLENCCCLCRSCNGKVNFNREYWTLFFRKILSDLYGYNYLEVKNAIFKN